MRFVIIPIKTMEIDLFSAYTRARGYHTLDNRFTSHTVALDSTLTKLGMLHRI